MFFRAATLVLVSFLITLFTISVFATENFKSIKTLKTPQVISEDGISFLVTKKAINKSKTESNQNSSLIVGYPIELIGESSVFGAVITKVSDREDENLGGLKLSNIIGFVRTETKNTNDHGGEFRLRGAFGEHLETTPLETTLTVPFVRDADVADKIFLDFSTLGDSLDIVSALTATDPDYEELFQGFERNGSRVVTVDYSIKTLVFDVESAYKIVQKEKDIVVSQKDVVVTTRWFMRLGSSTSPFFTSRQNVDGVGFFQTSYTNKNAPITRFGISDLQRQPIKYYLKGVPKIWEPAFVSSLFDWNHKLQSTLGFDFLSYEILDPQDPRYEQIVTGDVRYNVIEWDINNRASYGGLGPNIANPMTGEVLSAQTLIQGPAVEELYTNWFQVNDPNPSVKKAVVQKSNFKFAISLNKKAQFKIPSQDPNLNDTTGIRLDPDFRMDFVPTPAGYTYESYMNGYFRDMVAHEVGHNIGLRHNFKGSLADDDSERVGTPSWSVMEYLPRTQRHLSRVGSYDIMAIAYGYLGIRPTRTDMFCTDEDSGGDTTSNPECSSSDATSDSYSFYLSRMNRGLDLLLNRGVDSSPTWTMAQLAQYLPGFIGPIAEYGLNAENTSTTWLNFFKDVRRPKEAAAIYDYVRNDLNTLICDASLDAEVSKKSNEGDRVLAQENLTNYRKAMLKALGSVAGSEKLLKDDQLSCFQ
jgi:uncharacterized protein YkuJ